MSGVFQILDVQHPENNSICFPDVCGFNMYSRGQSIFLCAQSSIFFPDISVYKAEDIFLLFHKCLMFDGCTKEMCMFGTLGCE